MNFRELFIFIEKIFFISLTYLETDAKNFEDQNS